MSGSTLNETVQYRWKRLQQIEVEIKLKYKSGKNWGTLTTDRWLQGDRLIQVRLYLQDKFIRYFNNNDYISLTETTIRSL